MIDEEDVLRIQNVSIEIANTVYDAYKRRFPTMDEEKLAIVINSLLIVIGKYLLEAPEEIRDRYVIATMDALAKTTGIIRYDFTDELPLE